MKAQETGHLTFNWYDMTGPTYEDRTQIKVNEAS